MVEPKHDCSCYLPRNLSYEGTYHTKYYYPIQKSSSTNPGASNIRRGLFKTSAPQKNVMDSQQELKPKETCNVCSGKLPNVELDSSCANNSSSSLSDSVFSEDYTDMNDIDFKVTPQTEADHDAEVDSTYLSDRSSVSTLENEESGDNGESVDRDSASDGGIDIPPTDGLQAPDIKLTFGTPPVDRKMDASKEAVGAEACASDDDDHEFAFLGTEPIRRATSLKTYKTPPGTPGRKKAVRFADALGLDLEKVRHILNLDDPPTVPNSALRDLKLSTSLDDDKSKYRQGVFGSVGNKYLCACFQQPSAHPGFVDRVKASKVSLENCMVDDRDMTISGIVKVLNVAYHKTVIIRYSTNNWLTFEDVHASYVLNSNDGTTDRFSFTINVPRYFAAGSKLAFCIMYMAGTDTFWDNNSGTNYNIECYARSSSIDATDNSWVHFI